MRGVRGAPSQVPREALQRAEGVIDEMEGQIERTVDDVFAQVDLDADGAITQAEWRVAWQQNEHIARAVGLGGVLATMPS